MKIYCLNYKFMGEIFSYRTLFGGHLTKVLSLNLALGMHQR